VLRDEELIESARSSAVALIESDPELKNAPHLAREVEALMQEESASFVDKG
jgi:ATP-dependent DNA helicase RecG